MIPEKNKFLFGLSYCINGEKCPWTGSLTGWVVFILRHGVCGYVQINEPTNVAYKQTA